MKLGMSVFVIGVNLLSANRSGGMAECWSEGVLCLKELVLGKCCGVIINLAP